MEGLFGLQRLVEFTERSYLRKGALTDDNFLAGPELDDSGMVPFGLLEGVEPDKWERTCRVHFHRAVYRVLLAGAVLAGWHMEPFNIPNDLPQDTPANLRLFIETCSKPLSEDSDVWCPCLHPKEEDLAYLEKFISFDQEANIRVSQKQDAVFGPLGYWLIRSMKNNISPADIDTPEQFSKLEPCQVPVDEKVLLRREVMRMLAAYETLTRPLCNYNQGWGHGRWCSGHPETDCEPLPDIQTGHKVLVVVLGVYQLEQIQFWDEGSSAATPVKRLQDGKLGPVQEHGVDIYHLQEWLYNFSGRENVRNPTGDPYRGDMGGCTPPRLQLFSFLLHRYFDAGFKGHLWKDDEYGDYNEFLADGHLFGDVKRKTRFGDLGPSRFGEILTNIGSEPTYSFRRNLSMLC